MKNLILPLLGLTGIAILGSAGDGAPLSISQAGREFAPGAVTVTAGDKLRIVNDDRFVHNVYAKTDNLKLDTKAQRPGDGIDVYFRERGYYELGCKIHPKMSLNVTVE